VNDYFPEPPAVRWFLPILVACAAFYVVQSAVAATAYVRARRSGHMGLTKGTRRFWVFGGLILFTLLGFYASGVVAYRRETQLKQLRSYEAAHPGDRGPRQALLRELRIERNVGAVMFVGFIVSGLLWGRAVHEDGWVGPESLGGGA